MLQIDLVTQAAEAKCPEPWACPDENGQPIPAVHLENCPTCQGTDLRWPTLSRECPGTDLQTLQETGGADKCECDGEHSDRIPDVSLEKVLPLIYSLWKASPADYILEHTERKYIGLWAACNSWYDKEDPKQITYFESTPLEAACAALLQT